MFRKEYLTEKGKKKIIVIKISMNKGLSDSLKIPSLVRLSCDIRSGNQIYPHWLSGFIHV
jgi:hypothetical protein